MSYSIIQHNHIKSMEVQRNTMSNNNKDWRQDDEGNDKDSNTTSWGGV